MARKPQPPRLSGAARKRRDQLILDMFVAGNSQQKIADNPQINLTKMRVSQIVNAELERATKDHILRNENAMTIYMARMEILVREAFVHVTEGDLKAIELARRLMADQAKIYDIAEETVTAGPVPPMSDTELDDAEPVDELARYRAQRRVEMASDG